MAMQRTTEGASGSHSLTREQAEPFAIRRAKEDFDAQPPKAQAETLARVVWLLRRELHSAEFRAQPSDLRRKARAVYGVNVEDLS